MTPATPWQPMSEAPDLWERQRRSQSGFHWRSVAIRTEVGALLYSPLPDTDDAERAFLDESGGLAGVIAPNHYHYRALPEFAAEHPHACFASSATALPRIEKKCGVAMDSLPKLVLPPNVALLEPPGLKTGEVWLRVRSEDSKLTWVVCDAFFSVEEPLRGLSGILLRMTGTAPGLRIGRTFTTLHMKGSDYRDWLLGELERDPPDVLVPSHGAVLTSGPERSLGERLRQLALARL